MNQLDDRFLTRQRAAEFLGCSAKNLERLAAEGGGPPYVRIGLRRVVYQKSELMAWTKTRKFGSRAHEMAAGGV